MVKSRKACLDTWTSVGHMGELVEGHAADSAMIALEIPSAVGSEEVSNNSKS